MIFRISRLPIIAACLFLCACSTLWEKDNTPAPSPLVQFTPTIKPRQLWDAHLSFGFNQEDLKFSPIIVGNDLLIVDESGTITALNRQNGKVTWKTAVNGSISSGLAANDKLIVVGSKNGEVFALSTFEHRLLWKATVHNEILAAPALSSTRVIIKSIDGKVTAFAAQDGHLLWRHQELEPNLILRGASKPQLSADAVVIGYASGKVQKLALRDGHELWSQNIASPDGAFAIQRMIDIDADPLISGNQVFAATYQGKIAGLNFSSGRTAWDHDISSYAGIAEDARRIYVSDAKSTIWAFDRENGRVVWKQTQLEARKITGPVVVGAYVVVGDAQGVLHWLNTEDGNFAGRVEISGRAIFTKPAAADKTIYTITKDGYLTAYTFD